MKLFKHGIVALSTFISSASLIAATFTGAIDEDWHTAGNWDAGVVPDSGSRIVVTSGKKVVYNSPEVFSCEATDQALHLGSTSWNDTVTELEIIQGTIVLNSSSTSSGSFRIGQTRPAKLVLNGGDFTSNHGFWLGNERGTSIIDIINGTMTVKVKDSTSVLLLGRNGAEGQIYIRQGGILDLEAGLGYESGESSYFDDANSFISLDADSGAVLNWAGKTKAELEAFITAGNIKAGGNSVAEADIADYFTVSDGQVKAMPVVRYYVDDDKADNNGDGLSWDNAKKTIDAAVTLAVDDGNQVYVKSGTYDVTETLTIESGVKVYGGFAGTETHHTQRSKTADGYAWEFSNTTTINAKINDESLTTGRVVSIAAGSLLDGVIVTGGGKGGIEFTGNDAILQNSVITDNTLVSADQAGSAGVFTNKVSNFLIDGCLVKNNEVTGTGGSYSSDCAGGIGALTYGNGGSTGTISNSKIVNNAATKGPGGIFTGRATDNTYIINCVVANNSGANGTGNEASQSAGVCAHLGGGDKCRVINSTVVNNKSLGTGTVGGIAYAVATNTVVWGNENSAAASAQTKSLNASSSYTAIEGVNLDSLNDDSEGPNFVKSSAVKGYQATGVPAADWQLTSYSKALLNSGDNSVVTTTVDIKGNDRIYNDLIVDLGAYEAAIGVYKVTVSNLYQKFSAGAPVAPTVDVVPSGTPVITYSSDGTNYSSTIPANVGYYSVKVMVPASGDYSETTVIEDFIVAPDSVFVSTTGTDTVTYGEGTFGTAKRYSKAQLANLLELLAEVEIKFAAGTYTGEVGGEAAWIITAGKSGLVISGGWNEDYSVQSSANITILRPGDATTRLMNVSSPVTLKYLTFDGRFDGTTAQNYSGAGAGIVFLTGSEGSTITKCTFSNFHASGYGGALVTISNTSVSECLFDNNFAESGGAIDIKTSSNVLFDRTIFQRNQSTNGARGIINTGGGAATNYTVTNSLFVHNSGAGCFVNGGATQTFINCNFVKNSTALCSWSGGITNVTNCIMWGNGNNFNPSGYATGSKVISYSAIQGDSSGGTVINLNATNDDVAGPNFYSPSTGVAGVAGFDPEAKWYLTASSPMLNSGDSAAISSYMTDLNGKLRDTDPEVDDVVDIGAYEYDSFLVTPAIGLEFVQTGSELSWTVEEEVGVKEYQIVDAITGVIIDVVTADGSGSYSLVLDSDNEVKLVVVDNSGYTQTFVPADGNILKVVYDLKEGWNLIAMPGDNADTDALKDVTVGGMWAWNGIAYETTEAPAACQGVWVYSPKTVQVVVAAEKSDAEISLQPGWNLVGPKENIKVPEAAHAVYSWNETYEELLQGGTMIQGVGYWVFSL